MQLREIINHQGARATAILSMEARVQKLRDTTIYREGNVVFIPTALERGDAVEETRGVIIQGLPLEGLGVLPGARIRITIQPI